VVHATLRTETLERRWIRRSEHHGGPASGTDTLLVLLIEPEADDAMRIQQFLARHPAPAIAVEIAESLRAGLDRLGHGGIDAVLLDLNQPECRGVDSYMTVSCAAPNIPVLVLGSVVAEAACLDAIRLGAQDYLVKGRLSAAQLGHAIRCAVERQHLIESLRGLSLTDELTGLLNRRGFTTMATALLRLGNRTGSQFLLGFADLDGLKRINDTYGHHEGDHAIALVGDLLRTTFRQSDVLARLGGDEFVVLALDGSGDKGQAALKRFCDALAHQNESGERPYRIELSIGAVAFSASESLDLSELMRRADRALYDDKKGKGKGEGEGVATRPPFPSPALRCRRRRSETDRGDGPGCRAGQVPRSGRPRRSPPGATPIPRHWTAPRRPRRCR